MRFKSGQRIHFVGIGGFGISAIARILLERGFDVSGSDHNQNALTDALMRDGAQIFIGHDAAYVQGCDLVIATSAAPDTHVEIEAARSLSIPVYRRRDILAPLMQGSRVIAIAGTHGKTTTTSMVVHILRTCGFDPSYIVGGVMANTGTNAGVGEGDLFVIEADEYGHMFLGLEPHAAIVTSLEYDHPDFFQTEAGMIDVFQEFIALLPKTGSLIACSDYPLLSQLVVEREQVGGDTLTYATHDPNAAVQVQSIRASSSGVAFDLILNTGGQIAVNAGTVEIPVAGTHNVLNAAAAITICDTLGVPFHQAASALRTFQSTGRRFEIRGERDDIIVVDDYAHHPTAIRATLDAARMQYPERTIWAIWQPHMYSRTQALIANYVDSFAAADHVLVTDIYAAREAAIPGVDGAWIADQINHNRVEWSGSIDATIAALRRNVHPNSVILVMSAGDATRIGTGFLDPTESE